MLDDFSVAYFEKHPSITCAIQIFWMVTWEYIGDELSLQAPGEARASSRWSEQAARRVCKPIFPDVLEPPAP